MRRLANWRTAFYEAIDAHRPYDFEWGRHDCALLTADCVKAVTGQDLAWQFRDRYATEAESKAVLAELGYANVEEILVEHFEEIHPFQALVGDVALVPLVRRRFVAVAPVVGSELAVFSVKGPMGLIPLTEAVRAFRIEIKE